MCSFLCNFINAFCAPFCAQVESNFEWQMGKLFARNVPAKPGLKFYLKSRYVIKHKMDLDRNLSALLSLKNDYLVQVEQEDFEHVEETLRFYNELLGDLSQNQTLALEVMTNVNFKHCLKELTGNC